MVVRVRETKTGIKGIYLRSKRTKDFYRGTSEKERKIKKMKIYLHMSEKSSNFAAQSVLVARYRSIGMSR